MHVGQEEQLLTAYLLGELPAEQKAEIEERCGLDGDLFDRLLARRDSLIDDYLGDRLTALQRHHFERRFMASAEHREWVEMVRSLLDVLAAEPGAEATGTARQAEEKLAEKDREMRGRLESASWWRELVAWWSVRPLALGLAILLPLLFLGLWAIFDSQRLRRQQSLSEAEQAAMKQEQQELRHALAHERERASRLEEDLRLAQTQRGTPVPTPSPSSAVDLLASVTLTSDFIQGDRGPGGGRDKLSLPRGQGWVQLQLKLRGDDYRSYRVSIQQVTSPDKRPVWRQAGLKAQTARGGKTVIVRLPANRFASAAMDYLVTLDGQTVTGNYENGVDRYSFQVEKK